MRESDIALLLGFAAQFDGRIQVDRLKIGAWALSLGAHVPYEFAKEAIAKHYGESKEMIMPQHLNIAWKSYNREQYELTRSQSARLELEQVQATKASPEFVANIMQQIKADLQQKRVQRNEGNQLTD